MRYRLSPHDSARWLAGGASTCQVETLVQEEVHRAPYPDTITVCLASGQIAFVATATHIARYLAPQAPPAQGGG